MRPSIDVPEASVYECYGCGRRTRGRAARTCPDCGSAMRDIGRARDL